MEYLNYSLRSVTEATETDTAKLNELLQKIGAKAEIQDLGDGYYRLSVKYDPEEVQKKVTRGAGRPQKSAKEWLTIGAVREMAKAQGVAATAEYLGLSKATYYRRMKEYANVPDGDTFHI